MPKTDRLGLPAVLADIAEVAGLEAARAVAVAKGGQTVYIPHKARPGHWLTDLVGMAAAQRICAHYSSTSGGGRTTGQRLLVPMANVRTGELMVRAIEAGGKNNAVAATTGKHERTVRRYRSRLRSGGMGPLFD